MSNTALRALSVLFASGLVGCAAGGRDSSAGSEGAGGSSAATTDASSGIGSSTVAGSTGAGGASASGATSGSGGTTDVETIEVVSGDGELVLAGWPGTDPLLVRVSKNGKPVANETVTWTATGPLHAASNQTTSMTDADGLTSIEVIGEQFQVVTSWVGATMTASIPAGASAAFTITIAYPGPAVGQGAVSPLTEILAPDSIDLGHHKAGSIVSGGIQAIVVAQVGPDVGKGIPDVGLRLADVSDWTKPAQGIACVGGTVLSDASGNASCDVAIGGRTGMISFQVVVGGYNLHTIFAEIDP